MHTFLRFLNDQHDQNFAEKQNAHNLLHAFCHLIYSLEFFYPVKAILV